MDELLYNRIKERFESYLQRGLKSIIAYHAYPISPNFISKLKQDGFKLNFYNATKGIYIELNK